jgi:hypothetical protein
MAALSTTSGEVWQAVTGLLAGTGLYLDDTHPGVLVISRPDRPDRGMIGVTMPDGYVSWLRERSAFHGDQPGYFGHLDASPPATPGRCAAS